MKIHIVQQGDTLWKLAKKYDVDFEQLKAVNNHLSNPDVIMPGMKIKIPTGGVPVKKQPVKKEEPIKATQPKELPKEAPVPKKEKIIPTPKEEVMVPPPPAPPIQQPIEVQPFQQPITQQQYLHHHHMNMNFNVYKPMQPPPPMPAPPKMPEMKELPKVEKPKPITPPVPPKKEMPKPPEKPMKEQPIATAPPSYPMQQNCYPVTGIMPGCAYPPTVPGWHPYQGMAPASPYGYQGPMGAPLAGYTAPPMGYPQMPAYSQVPPQMPVYPQSQFGMAPPANVDLDKDDDVTPKVPSSPMQVPPMPDQYWGSPHTQGFGDITMQQPMMQPPQPMMQQPIMQPPQPMMQQPMIPQSPPWGYQPQPMYPQFNPYQGQQFRYEDEDDESED